MAFHAFIHTYGPILLIPFMKILTIKSLALVLGRPVSARGQTKADLFVFIQKQSCYLVVALFIAIGSIKSKISGPKTII